MGRLVDPSDKLGQLIGQLVNRSVSQKGMSGEQQNRPILSADKNLSCVMQKSPDFVSQDRACSIFDDYVSQLFIYRTTNFVHVAMVIVYNGR